VIFSPFCWVWLFDFNCHENLCVELIFAVISVWINCGIPEGLFRNNFLHGIIIDSPLCMNLFYVVKYYGSSWRCQEFLIIYFFNSIIFHTQFSCEHFWEFSHISAFKFHYDFHSWCHINWSIVYAHKHLSDKMFIKIWWLRS
jgi:hypothetical protein